MAFIRMRTLVFLVMVGAGILGAKTFGPLVSRVVQVKGDLKALGAQLLTTDPALAEPAIRLFMSSLYSRTGLNLRRSDVSVERVGTNRLRLGLHVLLPYKLPFDPTPRFYETTLTTEVARAPGM